MGHKPIKSWNPKFQVPLIQNKIGNKLRYYTKGEQLRLPEYKTNIHIALQLWPVLSYGTSYIVLGDKVMSRLITKIKVETGGLVSP